MTTPCRCSERTDQFKLVREGTDQVRRAMTAPNPALVPVDERRPEHAMVFASAFSAYLKYFDLENLEQGRWQEFFASDVSAQLAVVAIEDVAVHRTTLKELLRSLEEPELPASGPDMIVALGAVFDCLGTLATRLDQLEQTLPKDQPLRGRLGDLIRSRLSPMLRHLVGQYLAGVAVGVVDVTKAPPADVRILGEPLESFHSLMTGPGLSAPEWPDGAGVVGWSAFVAVDPEPYKSFYGPSAAVVDRINYLARHNLFTAILETFLAVHARVVDEAGLAVQATFQWNGHEPHYALFLAFLKLLVHARNEVNGLTARHLDFYYRQVLRLHEHPATPSTAHVLVELAKHVDAHALAEGTLLKAGKDASGADAHFAVDRDLVANKGVVAEVRSLYRHDAGVDGALPLDDGRLFAQTIANLGESWHPFAEKVSKGGALSSIATPPAEVGFALATHHLWLAEGERTIAINVSVDPTSVAVTGGLGTAKTPIQLMCRLTTAEGWLEVPIDAQPPTTKGFKIEFTLKGNEPPITPYDPKVHGHAFATSLPILLVTVRHNSGTPWGYRELATVRLKAILVSVDVKGLRTFGVSNDLGPIDKSKPFQAYGAAPIAGSALVIGSKEAFQKRPSEVTLEPTWTHDPVPFEASPKVTIDYLDEGTWKEFKPSLQAAYDTEPGADSYELVALPWPSVDTPDLSPDTQYSTTSRTGFVRLKLTDDFGTDTYPAKLASWILHPSGDMPKAPFVPTMAALSISYQAEQTIDLTKPASDAGGRFYHVTPFGHAEQQLSGQGTVPLVPQFLTEPGHPAAGDLYIGVRGLAPPQNLALLFQVVEGTANPLLDKPDGHVHWSYLRGDEWVTFASDAVADDTDGLLASGIVTLAVPADATTQHTLLPPDRHWFRLSVEKATDAVCRLLTVAAQALKATYVVPQLGAALPTTELPPGTITKLDQPDAAVKGVSQPFPTYGGRPKEGDLAFATRASERLRHKDRAIALWDYEHLILEAFPAIYQARCLNHTQYEPSPDGAGIYRERLPGM